MSSSTDLTRVGEVRRPHGVAGFVVVHPDSDFPDRFASGARVLTPDGRELVVDLAQPSGQVVLVRFQGVRDRDGAEALRGLTLLIHTEERRPLDEDEFWPDELAGLEVVDPRGVHLGEVVTVLDGPAQQRLVVALVGGGTVEIPFVAELVPEVDQAGGRLVVNPIEGLLG